MARVRIRGRSVLASPLLNRGTAFTPEEREALGLTGLLPSGVSTMEAQLRRTYAQFGRQADDLGKNVYLANLRDRNEVLFYRLLTEHLEEMLPIVMPYLDYSTPTCRGRTMPFAKPAELSN